MSLRLYRALLAWITISLVCGCVEGTRRDVMVKKPWPVWDVAFSPDGRWLAAGRGYYAFEGGPPWGGEGEVMVWRVDDWKQRGGFSAHFTNKAQTVAFTADSKHLVAAADKYIRETRGSPWEGNVIFIWAVSDGTLAETFGFDDQNDTRHNPSRGAGSVISLAISPDSELIGLARYGSIPVILHRKTGERTYLAGHLGNSHGLAYSPNGKSVVSGTQMRPFVRLYDAASCKELARFDLEGGEPTFTCVRFSPNGKQIAVGLSDGSVRLLAADLSKQLRSIIISDDKEKVQALDYGARADTLAAATTTRVRSFDASSGKQLGDWEKAELPVSTVALSPDAKLLAVGYGGAYVEGVKGDPRSGYVNIFDTATGRLVKKLD